MPKKLIFELFKPKKNDIDNNNNNINGNFNTNINCKQMFLDQFETCFSQKVLFIRSHSMTLPQLPSTLGQELYYKYYRGPDNYGNDRLNVNIYNTLKSMSFVGMNNFKKYSISNFFCLQPRIQRKNTNNDNAKDIIYTQGPNGFILRELNDNMTFDEQYMLNKNDCIQLCVEYINIQDQDDNDDDAYDSYTIDFIKVMSQDVLKNAFDKGKSVFGKGEVEN